MKAKVVVHHGGGGGGVSVGNSETSTCLGLTSNKDRVEMFKSFMVVHIGGFE